MFQSSIRIGAIAAASVTLQLLLAAGPAGAQPTAEQQSALRNNCRSDFMSHCSGVTPGGAQALQCLQRNVAKLSPGCRGAVNALAPQPAPQQATTAPPPAPAAATAVAPAQARPAAAMPAAAPATPAPAASSGAPTPEQQAALRQLCGADYMAKCSHVAPASHQALQCLQSHSAELSANCRGALALFSPGGAPQPAAAPAPTAAP
ncbi:MAG: cysteine rich repeat-containing protein, partial [Xanthobacteraceae bacterium]|nr:cysteine rich repeat-containing protein [Xanthobacteraceae bacterium]